MGGISIQLTRVRQRSRHHALHTEAVIHQLLLPYSSNKRSGFQLVRENYYSYGTVHLKSTTVTVKHTWAGDLFHRNRVRFMQYNMALDPREETNRKTQNQTDKKSFKTEPLPRSTQISLSQNNLDEIEENEGTTITSQ